MGIVMTQATDRHLCQCLGCPECQVGHEPRCMRFEETRVCDACWRHMLSVAPRYPPDTEYE